MKPDPKKKLFRKRLAVVRTERSTHAPLLRQIRDAVQSDASPKGLQQANKIIQENVDSSVRLRALSLVGDHEIQKGRFQKAAEIFSSVSRQMASDSELWFRPKLGEITALLRAGDRDGAVRAARTCLVECQKRQKAFNDFILSAEEVIRTQGSIRVPRRPLRISVIANQLGRLFLAEGEIATAKGLFEKALEENPNGAARARQGLAEIALRENRPEDALRLASESLLVGKFQAKTLMAWPLLVRAKRHLGTLDLGPELLAGLTQAKPSVRARALLVIAKELRASDSSQWMKLSEEWLSREATAFPAVAAELRKLLLRHEKSEAQPVPEKQLDRAQRLMETPNLSPSEWLSAAKEVVRVSLILGRKPEIAQLVNQGSKRWGESFAFQLRHSLALSAMMAKRHDLARGMLESNIRERRISPEIQAKSLWALARMEAFLKNHDQAAILFDRFANLPDIPLALTLKARIEWANALVQTGNTKKIIAARGQLEAVLRSVDDPDILMNFARQLLFAPAALKSLSDGFFLRGQELARRQIAQTENPSVARKVLFHLARRQVLDFRAYGETMADWHTLSPEKRTWLWSEENNFWEYLSLVFLAYERGGLFEEASQFAETFLEDAATPPIGVAHLGVCLGTFHIRRGNSADGLRILRKVVTDSPQLTVSAEAHYWLALSARKKGLSEEATHHARFIRQCLGTVSGMAQYWELDAKALLLLSNLQIDDVHSHAVNYSPEKLQLWLKHITRDLERLP
jgi:tetratricopeptide (TPR) repeat protein